MVDQSLFPRAAGFVRQVEDDQQHKVRMALVSVTIEKALLDIGKPLYDQVCVLLYSKYRAFMPQCFEHPEYLKNVLREIYGKASDTIMQNIIKQLEEYEYPSIVNFVKGLTK